MVRDLGCCLRWAARGKQENRAYRKIFYLHRIVSHRVWIIRRRMQSMCLDAAQPPPSNGMCCDRSQQLVSRHRSQLSHNLRPHVSAGAENRPGVWRIDQTRGQRSQQVRSQWKNGGQQRHNHGQSTQVRPRCPQLFVICRRAQRADESPRW